MVCGNVLEMVKTWKGDISEELSSAHLLVHPESQNNKYHDFQL